MPLDRGHGQHTDSNNNGADGGCDNHHDPAGHCLAIGLIFIVVYVEAAYNTHLRTLPELVFQLTE